MQKLKDFFKRKSHFDLKCEIKLKMSVRGMKDVLVPSYMTMNQSESGVLATSYRSNQGCMT